VDIILTHGITRALIERVDEYYRPKLHIFGHYHTKNGIIKGKNTIFINAACIGRFSLPLNPFVVIDMEKKENINLLDSPVQLGTIPGVVPENVPFSFNDWLMKKFSNKL